MNSKPDHFTRRGLLASGMKTAVGMGLVAAGSGTAGCSFVSPAPFGAEAEGRRLERMKKSPNYRDGRFHNRVPGNDHPTGKSRGQIMREFITDRSRPTKPVAEIPVVKTDFADVPEDSAVWLGHSGYFMRMGKWRILIDPALNQAFPFPGFFKPFPGTGREFCSGTRLREMGMKDVYHVLFITHDHYDHLDYSTAALLEKVTRCAVCPLGVGAHLQRWGWPAYKITELDWDQDITFRPDNRPPLRVTLVTSHHFSGRSMDGNTTLWGGFVIEEEGRTVYVSGDGGWGPHFADIAARWPSIDFAMIELGQYNEDWAGIHLMPDDWERAVNRIAPKSLMACHNGKYDLSRHAWFDPLNEAWNRARAMGVALKTPRIGEPFSWLDRSGQEPWWEELQAAQEAGEKA